MPDNGKQYEPGAELLPDWNDTPVTDALEPDGDEHEEGDE